MAASRASAISLPSTPHCSTARTTVLAARPLSRAHSPRLLHHHAQLVLQQYALCPRAGYDVVAITELCNPDLISAFESRLRQLQSRADKPGACAARFPPIAFL
jgi:hypothetical protein